MEKGPSPVETYVRMWYIDSMKKYVWDALLLVMLLAVIIATFVVTGAKALHDGDTGYVNVYIDGELYNSYLLSKDGSHNIDTSFGHNRILIENNEVTVSEADCPDELCVDAFPISKSGESIVCLPNRMVVVIKSETEGEIDAVAY